MLGMMYLDASGEGEGVDEDKLQEAMEWVRKAAEQGQANAQYVLCMMYAAGKGVEQDEAQAVEWLRKAAEQGHAEAQEALQEAESGSEGMGGLAAGVVGGLVGGVVSGLGGDVVGRAVRMGVKAVLQERFSSVLQKRGVGVKAVLQKRFSSLWEVQEEKSKKTIR